MADKVHHVLVVGTGSIGERHLRCFLATERTSVSFVEPQTELRETIAKRYPQTTPFESLEAALSQSANSSNPFCSAVVATPAPLHIQQAQLLLEHDLHVLIEKPLSLKIEGVEQLLQTAETVTKVVGVAYVHRANPVLQEMRDVLLSGQLGKPVELVAVCGQHFPTYRPAYREIYYRDRAMGGGAIQDALTHIINAGQWLVGNMDRVVADAEHLVLEGVEVEDTVHVLARHNNVLANYSLNQHQAANETTLTTNCEQGSLRFEAHKQQFSIIEKPDAPWKVCAEFSLERDTLFTRQADAFLDAIEGIQPILCNLQEGFSSMQVNLAILKSLETKSWEPVATN